MNNEDNNNLEQLHDDTEQVAGKVFDTNDQQEPTLHSSLSQFFEGMQPYDEDEANSDDN